MSTGWMSARRARACSLLIVRAEFRLVETCLVALWLAAFCIATSAPASAQIIERRPCISGSMKDSSECYCPSGWTVQLGDDGVNRCARPLPGASSGKGVSMGVAAVAAAPAEAGGACGRESALDQDIVNGQLLTYAAVKFDPNFGDACLCEGGALVRISSRLYGCRIPSGLPITCNGGFLDLERNCVCLNQPGKQPARLGPNDYDCFR